MEGKVITEKDSETMIEISADDSDFDVEMSHFDWRHFIADVFTEWLDIKYENEGISFLQNCPKKKIKR